MRLAIQEPRGGTIQRRPGPGKLTLMWRVRRLNRHCQSRLGPSEAGEKLL